MCRVELYTLVNAHPFGLLDWLLDVHTVDKKFLLLQVQGSLCSPKGQCWLGFLRSALAQKSRHSRHHYILLGTSLVGGSAVFRVTIHLRLESVLGNFHADLRGGYSCVP
jgi:hypothetical protein